MSKMAYLDEIAAKSRPVKPKKASILSPKLMVIIGGGLGLVILLAIVGAMLGNAMGRVGKDAERISFRMERITEIIKEYKGDLKAPKLRSVSVSLDGVLKESNGQMKKILAEEFKVSAKDGKDKGKGKDKGGKLDKKAIEEESENYNKINEALENARLNGVLDRTYAREMALQVALLISMESELAERSEKKVVDEFVAKSLGNLQKIYKQLSEYSETVR